MTTKQIETLVPASLFVVGMLFLNSALAQDKVPPPPPPPPAPAPPDLKPILEDVRRQVEIARDQVAEAWTVAGDAVAPWLGGGGEFGFSSRLGPRPARSVVVPAAEMDAATITGAEEDLTIMARILEKTLPGRDGEKAERRAMGIPIVSSGGNAPVRNLLLEGYGAVFFLDVRYPLLPPEKPSAETNPKDEKSSAWEEARSELYTPRGPKRNAMQRYKESGRDGVEAYDESRVQRLQTSLVDALKHATHIRALKPDELVTVIVTGAGGGTQDNLFVKELTGPDSEKGERDRRVYSINATGYVRIKPGEGAGTLTMRARKADIDAFADGKLDLDQFKKKVVMRLY